MSERIQNIIAGAGLVLMIAGIAFIGATADPQIMEVLR